MHVNTGVKVFLIDEKLRYEPVPFLGDLSFEAFPAFPLYSLENKIGGCILQG